MGPIEWVGPDTPLQKNEVRLSGRTVWRIYLCSMALTLVVSVFNDEILIDVINGLGWFGVLLWPHIPAMLAGVYISFGWSGALVVAGFLFLGWVAYSFVKVEPMSVSRHHSHGDYAHSHKYDERLLHYHKDNYPDRVYYR